MKSKKLGNVLRDQAAKIGKAYDGGHRPDSWSMQDTIDLILEIADAVDPQFKKKKKKAA